MNAKNALSSDKLFIARIVKFETNTVLFCGVVSNTKTLWEIFFNLYMYWLKRETLPDFLFVEQNNRTTK